MPETSLYSLIQRLYPYKAMMGKEGQTAVTDALSVCINIKKNVLNDFNQYFRLWMALLCFAVCQ